MVVWLSSHSFQVLRAQSFARRVVGALRHEDTFYKVTKACFSETRRGQTETKEMKEITTVTNNKAERAEMST